MERVEQVQLHGVHFGVELHIRSNAFQECKGQVQVIDQSQNHQKPVKGAWVKVLGL